MQARSYGELQRNILEHRSKYTIEIKHLATREDKPFILKLLTSSSKKAHPVQKHIK